MYKKMLLSGIVVLLALGGCNNFFHDLVPPDENRITSFSVPGQLEQAAVGENSVHVTVGPGVNISELIPAISVSTKATLIPVTIPYIQKAFPSANVFQDGMGFYTSQDKADYVIDLIKRNQDFNAPVLDEAIDFSGPVTFLVISGLGSIRQYTVTVEVDSGEGKFLSFGFTKFDNPDLTRGDAAGTINNAAKTIDVEVWYPVENIASFKLVPNFQTNGAAVTLGGNPLSGGVSEIDFTKPASGGWISLVKTATLTVQRPGFASSDYTLTVTFKEDPDTSPAITDFRFDKNYNYGIAYTAMGEITNTGDTGTITVRVHHTGPVPATLIPSFVSPGSVEVEGAPQSSGVQSHDFSQPVYYDTTSKDGSQHRSYRVTVEFVGSGDARPRINGFAFTMADNASLAANSSALIDHAAGLIVIEAVYIADPPPYTLRPQFSAGGTVSVGGVVQTSGVSGQDFSHKVKYTVKDPGNPSLYRDYWVEVRFVKDSLSLAEISAFRFMAADNPDLSGDVTAVIDQGAGTIYAVLPFTGPPPSGNGGHRTLVPRWLAQGTVRVGGVTQNSGQSGQVFSPSVVYRAVSADGAFHKDYTVKVLEVNTRMYVKKNAAGDNTGVSWANAFRSLGDACDAAGYLPTALAAEVWIAEGTYRPSETRDKAAYFTVRPNTGYYGGFAGTETAKDGRNPDPTAHRVIITGDLGGGVYSEHLFINTNLGGGNAAFGEMTFTKARGPLTGLGSAMHVSGANSVAITNSVFEDLQAGPGGVVYVSLFSGGSVTITDCDFENIQATGYGGAVYATAYGGSGGSVTITNCDFENTQSTLGGAVYAAASGGSVTITDCDFKNTQAGNGGAVAALASSTGSVTITDCDFENTRAELSGGAVHVSTSSGASVTITDCEFTDTETTGAYGSGGAVYAYGSGGSVTITDCDFTDTKATAASSRGGAVYARSNGAVSITNCGFTNTQTEEYGGAVYAYGGSVTISGYTSNITRALAGGSLFLSTSNSGLISVTDAEITDSKTVNSLSDGSFSGGGGICVSNAGSTTFSNVKFENVHAMGSVTNTIGGAVRFSMGSLVMTNCSIEDASSDTFGGAIAGSGSSSCTLEGVSFTSCAAPQGSILYGNEWSPGAGPAYIVKPGCEVNGIPITAANLLSVLASPSQRYLINGSTIGWSP